MPLDAETKAKYIDLYRSFTGPWTRGACDMLKVIPEVAEEFVSDDFVFENSEPIPKTEGKQAFIDSAAMWGGALTCIHSVLQIWCTDESWVNAVVVFSFTGHNADKSKIGADMGYALNRIHINDDGKIDKFESHWDTSHLLPQLA